MGPLKGPHHRGPPTTDTRHYKDLKATGSAAGLMSWNATNLLLHSCSFSFPQLKQLLSIHHHQNAIFQPVRIPCDLS